jgi:hypothetical protein
MPKPKPSLKRSTGQWNSGPSKYQKRMRMWTIGVAIAVIILFGALFYFVSTWSLTFRH